MVSPIMSASSGAAPSTASNSRSMRGSGLEAVSSAQRVASFKVGLRDGTISACNFFDPDNRNYPASR